ncbi:uncharacterized protein EV422DRAFT_564554 [Fimicolochytrium jonesii]|uniref:uncharacterized protein n=1 Tax=Fimicolochytrium jonesii TaxID=1396493 RepID=UPI0022FE3C13|nr:uncharacterized protein EV422DRAFT_564554 [Fimicolochytrium jonesii]KAI8825226.1 hypothetical protein EV422DRAFT_564554 [Fimicolochytrium jonesii]
MIPPTPSSGWNFLLLLVLPFVQLVSGSATRVDRRAILEPDAKVPPPRPDFQSLSRGPSSLSFPPSLPSNSHSSPTHPRPKPKPFKPATSFEFSTDDTPAADEWTDRRVPSAYLAPHIEPASVNVENSIGNGAGVESSIGNGAGTTIPFTRWGAFLPKGTAMLGAIGEGRERWGGGGIMKGFTGGEGGKGSRLVPARPVVGYFGGVVG